MAASSNFKRQRRSSRIITDVSYPLQGMQYVDTPIDHQHCRVMVNMDINNTDGCLEPRSGYTDTILSQSTYTSAQGYKNIRTNVYKLLVLDSNKNFLDVCDVAITTSSIFISYEGFKGNICWGIKGATIEDTPKSIDVNNFYIRGDSDYNPVTVNITQGDSTALLAFNSSHNIYNYYLIKNSQDELILTKSIIKAYEPLYQEFLDAGYNMLCKAPYTPNSQRIEGVTDSVTTIMATWFAEKDSTGNFHAIQSISKTQTSFYIGFCLNYTGTPLGYTDSVNHTLINTGVLRISEPSNLSYTGNFSVERDLNDMERYYIRIDPSTTHSCMFPSSNTQEFAQFKIDIGSLIPDVPPVLTSLIYFEDSAQANSLKSKTRRLPTYDLTKATNALLYKDRLVVYGVPNAKSTVFFSLPGEYTYFPFPQQTITFNDGILQVIEYCDNLLVFTATQLHMINFNTDGYPTYKTFQDGIVLDGFEPKFTKVIKNMVFYKVGDNLNLVVPNVTPGYKDYTVAPISYAIDKLMKDLDDEVLNITNAIRLNEGKTITCLNSYNYVDGNVVRNVFCYRNSDNLDFDFVINYDTLNRIWTLYIQDGSICPVFKIGNNKYLACFYTFDGDGYLTKVKYYKRMKYGKTDDIIGLVSNVQYLDTGYKIMDNNIKNKYRGIQFDIVNKAYAGTALKFYTGIAVDHKIFKPLLTPKAVLNTDGSITVYEALIDAKETPDQAVIYDTNYYTWELDSSVLEQEPRHTINLNFALKGKNPRFELLNTQEQDYRITDFRWIYRPTNGR